MKKGRSVFSDKVLTIIIQICFYLLRFFTFFVGLVNTEDMNSSRSPTLFQQRWLWCQGVFNLISYVIVTGTRGVCRNHKPNGRQRNTSHDSLWVAPVEQQEHAIWRVSEQTGNRAGWSILDELDARQQHSWCHASSSTKVLEKNCWLG